MNFTLKKRISPLCPPRKRVARFACNPRCLLVSAVKLKALVCWAGFVGLLVLPLPLLGQSSEPKPIQLVKPQSEQQIEPLNADDEAKARSLILLLQSASYKTRKQAEEQLLQFDEPLLALIDELEESSALETRVCLGRIKMRIESRGLLGFQWNLVCTPDEGESISLKSPTVIEFPDNGQFRFNSGGDPDERWRLLGENQLEFSYNDRYSVYVGTINDEGEIVGRATNCKGKAWNFHMRPLGRATEED